jgi:phosphate starvation-inducible PhoH-like protein
VEKTLLLGNQDNVVRLLGPQDSYLKRLRDAFQVEVIARGSELRIAGPEENVRGCEAALMAMEEELNEAGAVTQELVDRLIERHRSRSAAQAGPAAESALPWPGAAPRTPGQEAYVKAMLAHDLVFCIGPAGTGKTYLAVAVALSHLRRGGLNRIVLCRPAVEAGESLGFLPGDMYAKVNPYLRPLYDALHDLMDVRRVRRYIDSDIIEILPLAFVRGRTLDNACIILDEAQNCTVGQMKTFLTRLGPNAKLVVTGDITQVDLPPDEKSGLVDALERLSEVPGIGFVRLTERDIVRHRLVRLIVDAYQRPLPAAPGGTPPAKERDGASGQ